MVWPYLKIIGHGEDNSAGDNERSKRERKTEEDNIKEWTGMGFGDSPRAAETNCCICEVPRCPPRSGD